MKKLNGIKPDINLVSTKDLVSYLSISLRLAKRIISLRPYTSMEQIDQIWGIDEEIKQKIKREFFIQSTVEGEKLEDLNFHIPVPDKDDDNGISSVSGSVEESGKSNSRRTTWFSSLILIFIFLLGAYFRFTGINWDESKHQHPDERYLTMVAEKIHSVSSFDEYFDTENSSLNPVVYGSYTYGMLPLFVTRYVAEWLDMTSYDMINLVGRVMSGVFDLAAIFALYLLAKRLYGKKVGIVSAALYAAAVLPIQLSHYFAVDSFSTFFVVLSFYFLLLAVPIDRPDQKITDSNYIYFGIFGFLTGLAGACKVNTLPVLGMIIFASGIYLFLIRKQPKFWKSFWTIFLALFLAGLSAFLAFRIFQPYAFMGPEVYQININQRWFDVIKTVTNQVAGNSEWPPNHHWTSRPTQYAWVNMVLWGMGIPLGLIAWFGLGWVGFRIWKGEWRNHIFPFTWVILYFVWQNMQFWRYMRYFIPIYPFLIMFGGWALVRIYDKYPLNLKGWIENKRIEFSLRKQWRNGLSFLLFTVVLIGTFTYAFAFTRIYTRTHTRVEASRWIFSNIYGPLNVQVDSDGETNSYPIEVFNNRIVERGAPLQTDFEVETSGTTTSVIAPQIRKIGGYLHFWISTDVDGKDKVVEIKYVIPDDEDDGTLSISLRETNLTANTQYYFNYRFRNNDLINFDGITLNKNNEENPIQIELPFENDKAGIYIGSIPFMVDQDKSINQINIQNFQQEFLQLTAKVKLSLFTKDDKDNPLAVSEKSLDITAPGISFNEDFQFDSVKLDNSQEYTIRFELLEGDAIQLLAENYTLETSWDDSLPLGVDGYNVGGIYSPYRLELYEADTPEKRDRMIAILEKSEYIVVPSNRGYDAMPRLVTRYPLTTRYYQLLFDCDCVGDEMEKWAYQLEAPFTSPLGFELIETFESYPSLGSLEFNDQNADESFTVYDHPKVFIFKKSDSFSIEKVKEELFRVDLDNVIFQRPIDVSKADNRLLLPVDRLTAQTEGGTWSDIFKRDSLLNQNQFLTVVVWYIFILVLGWIVLPLSGWIFRALPDKGYSLVRMLGLLLLTWLTWFSGSLELLKFSRGSILLLIVLLAAINFRIYTQQKITILENLKVNWKYTCFVETLALILFLFSLQIRIANPDLWQPWFGGEKPMEFAFFNAVNKAVYFPPQNPWFSDHYINYYYYGFIIAAIPTKVLGVIPSIAYNLIIPTWFAMTGIGLFGVGFNFYNGFVNRRERSVDFNNEIEADRKNNSGKIGRKLSPYFAGLFSLVFVLFIGNFYQAKQLAQYLPEASEISQDAGADNKLVSVLSGAVNVFSGDSELPGSPSRWYFDASRPILHDGPDTPIAEFPYFTFLYADLHPHLLSMPFYALGFAWCLTLLLDPLHKKRWYQQLSILIMAGLIFGMYRVTHTWDYPIFIGLGFLVLVWTFMKDKSLTLEKQIKKIIIYTVIFVGFSILFYLPFTYWFKTAYNSIEFWDGARTPLKDYFVVFGMSIFVMFSYLIFEGSENLKQTIKNWKNIKLGQVWLPLLIIIVSISGAIVLWHFEYQVLAFGLPCIFIWLWEIFFRKNQTGIKQILWSLFAIGYGLTFVVEILVLKGDVGRANMVFRMYNLAWFILGITMSIALMETIKLLKSKPKIVEVTWLIVFIILFISGLLYPTIATNKKMNDRWPNVENPPKTLDGALFMLGNPTSSGEYTPALYTENDIEFDLSLDYEGIKFMQDHVIGSPVIVEGHTSEYRWGARYSIHTGLPSVIGWSWHTRQHNSLLDRAVVDKRIEEVNNFYNSIDLDEAMKFINKYRVEYIIISGLERAKYNPEGLKKFNKMVDEGDLSIVFGHNATESAMIIRVNQD